MKERGVSDARGVTVLFLPVLRAGCEVMRKMGVASCKTRIRKMKKTMG